MNFTITPEQHRAIDVLMAAGFVITNYYADGILRMAINDSIGNHAVFIRPCGRIKQQVIPTFAANGDLVDTFA